MFSSIRNVKFVIIIITRIFIQENLSVLIKRTVIKRSCNYLI